MDTSYLYSWDAKAEQRKSDFMEHMYKCSARTNGLFTGLWQDFCLKEAGPYCQNMYFEQLEAIKEYEDHLAQQREREIKEEEDFKFGIEQLVLGMDLDTETITLTPEKEWFDPALHD